VQLPDGARQIRQYSLSHSGADDRWRISIRREGAVSSYLHEYVFEGDVLQGWGVRPFNWQGSVALQHELAPGMALNVGYFRTWYQNFLVTDNLATTAADYDSFCVTTPTDGRLPNSGQQLCGLYDVKPALFGVTQNLRTQASNYGKRSEVYNGIDVTLNSRFAQRGQFSGGLSIGRTVYDACEVTAKVPEALQGIDTITQGAGGATSWTSPRHRRRTRPPRT